MPVVQGGLKIQINAFVNRLNSRAFKRSVVIKGKFFLVVIFPSGICFAGVSGFCSGSPSGTVLFPGNVSLTVFTAVDIL